MNFLDNCFYDPIKNRYPIYLKDLKKAYPQTSFPAKIDDSFLTFLGLKKVVFVAKPSVNSVTHDLSEGTPVKIGEHYHQNWIATNLNLSENEQRDRLSMFKEETIAKLAAYRFELEVGGISVNGVTVKTDRESQAQLASALLTINEGFANSINWKSANGWVNLDKKSIQQISKIVAQHVQGCFNVEQMHASKILNFATIEELSNYDFKTGWPTTTY